MKYDKERFTYLINGYAANTLTDVELSEFFDMLDADSGEAIQQALMELLESTEPIRLDAAREERIFKNILQKKTVSVFRFQPVSWQVVGIAASLLLLAAAAIFLLTPAGQDAPVQTYKSTDVPKNDVAPGSSRAILTLGNGTTVALGSTDTLQSVDQGSSHVSGKHGLLRYSQKQAATTEVVFNTLTTPRGGSYHIVLSDGTKAWLNAASSIRFPTAFIGDERIVEITGEVYLEVAKSSRQKFKVKVGDMQVIVTGTHFNINSYADYGNVETTLLEGEVSVVKNGTIAKLAPGQQAKVSPDGEMKIEAADIQKAVAWKNGYFYFNRSDINTVMQQIERWYDVDVKYEGDVTTRFSGSIPRNMNASKVFRALELTGGVHFKIDGNRVIVTN